MSPHVPTRPRSSPIPPGLAAIPLLAAVAVGQSDRSMVAGAGWVAESYGLAATGQAMGSRLEVVARPCGWRLQLRGPADAGASSTLLLLGAGEGRQPLASLGADAWLLVDPIVAVVGAVADQPIEQLASPALNGHSIWLQGMTLLPGAAACPSGVAVSNALKVTFAGAAGGAAVATARVAAGSGLVDDTVRGPRRRAAPGPGRTSVRRGLAVIADFADFQLEDWTGPGMNTVGELETQLAAMADHWLWLSGGDESFAWDVVRITLPAALGPNAYAGWMEYRDAVAALVRQQVAVPDYDADGDGVVDSAWVIAASGGYQFPYLLGGASRNAGVNLFVDLQDSMSVVTGATGNFNHELAHTLGVPDLYGSHGTIAYLTLMSDSWALPPQDFTAYERTLLGWLRPDVVHAPHKRVRLSAARQLRNAVRIDTNRDCEYFLLELRQRPASGYGSNAPDYNGLAIYHVLEGSDQWQDPPLLKLEAADGAIAPGALPTVSDFLYPGNPHMTLPFVLRSYFGGEEVFRVTNVAWGNGGRLECDITRATQSPPSDLLANSGFEQGVGGLPTGWTTGAWQPGAEFAWDATTALEGTRSVSIASTVDNDAHWSQSVTGLTPGASYRLTGWLRGEGIGNAPGAIGGNLCVLGGFSYVGGYVGTFDWTEAALVFQAPASDVEVAARLGFFSSTASGRLWCDGMRLEPLRSAFP